MGACYGVQKLSSMWTGSDPERVKAAWADALGKYPPEAIAEAVRATPEAHPSWPPTLGEFCTLTQSFVPREKWKPALPVPKRTAEEIERGAAEMDKIRAMLGRTVKRMPSRVPGEDDA